LRVVVIFRHFSASAVSDCIFHRGPYSRSNSNEYYRLKFPFQYSVRNFLRENLQSDLRRELLRGMLGSVLIKAVMIAATLTASVLLARLLGAKGFGEYAFAMTLAAPLITFSKLGMPPLIVRETAKAHQNKNWSEMLGLWKWSSQIALRSVSILCAVAFAVAYITLPEGVDIFGVPLGWALLAVPVTVFLNLITRRLKGLRRVILAPLLNEIIPKIVMILVLALVAFNLGGDLLTPQTAAAISFFAGAGTLLLAWVIFRRCLPFPSGVSLSQVIHQSTWVKAALPLSLLVVVRAANQHAAILMLGIFAEPENVGLYRAAAQLATNVSMGIGIVTMVAQPYYAQFHDAGDLGRLQKLAKYSARASLLVALPLAVLLYGWGRDVLEVMFGDEFGAAYSVLVILITAQIANAGFGPVGVLLNMTDNANKTVRGVAIATAVNVALGLVLIPVFGILGAAIGVGAAMILWNFLLWRSIKRTLSIDCSAW
jgi:O-antigen/teichoic acid export membrane protein